MEIGIIILNYEEYIWACYNHLQSKQTQIDGSLLRYYRRADPVEIELAQEKIVEILQEGRNNDWITNDEFEAMDTSSKDPGKFYAMFKVHKKHQEGKAPPERPIISCCNSITENIGHYCASKLRCISNKHDSYLQDTPDFLRHIETINNIGRLPDNAILAALDVSAL